MTPVILLSDGYLANGSEPWRYPTMAELPDIKIPEPKLNGKEFRPYERDNKTLARYWVVPGTPGLEHRIGGLEKEELTGNVSYESKNHEKMVMIREEKVARVANFIPDLNVKGDTSGPLLVVGWGSTYGSLLTATKELQIEGREVSLAHFNYINPLPKNTGEVLSQFDKILVCELNRGQFCNYLKSNFPKLDYESYTKVQGQPFMVAEIKDKVISILDQQVTV